MNLKEYLFYKNQTIKEFSLAADFNACHISSVTTGQRRATPKLLRAIERATNGWVKPEYAFAETKVPDGFPVDVIIPLPETKDEDDELDDLIENMG